MQDKKWVAVWGNAVSITENRPERYAKNITLRYPVFMGFDGDRIRITLDNYCGTEDVTFSGVTIYTKGQDEKPFTDITFAGSTSVKAKAGERVVSDEIAFSVKRGDTCYISVYLGDYVQMRSGVYTQGPFSGGIYAVGDQTHSRDISIDIKRATGNVYFLSNVSLYTDSANQAIVCYGDSITAQDWPDYLYQLCDRDSRNTSVIRRATSGSRILREYSCITYESYGLMGTKRLPHELPTDGADTLIIQQGINDIIHPVGTDVNPFRPMSDLPTTAQLIDGLKWYIEEARKMGFARVYVGTLLPIKGWRTYADFREVMKNEYNDWIRQTNLIDGCIDFDKSLRDGQDMAAFSAPFDSGDHLHPSANGYMAMADTAYKMLWN